MPHRDRKTERLAGGIEEIQRERKIGRETGGGGLKERHRYRKIERLAWRR